MDLELSMVEARATRKVAAREVRIRADEVLLDGTLDVAVDTRGVVIFSHGSGSGRNSPRNRQVARSLCERGFATLLFDLLTTAEDASGSELRFDIALLTGRLSAAVRFAREEPLTKDLSVGLFGASTGAASALRVAASMTQG